MADKNFLSSQGTEVNKNSTSYASVVSPQKKKKKKKKEKKNKERKGLGPDYPIVLGTWNHKVCHGHRI